MKVFACQVPLGAPALLPCGCSAVTGQSYETAPHRPTSSACRPWIIDRACAAHPGRERAIIEIGASDQLDYESRFAGSVPTRVHIRSSDIRLLWPVSEATALDCIRDLVLAAYVETEAAATNAA